MATKSRTLQRRNARWRRSAPPSPTSDDPPVERATPAGIEADYVFVRDAAAQPVARRHWLIEWLAERAARWRR